MQEWLVSFFQNIEGSTLTLNGKTYKRSDCIRIGGGAEKQVCQFKGESFCFFIPNRYQSEQQWVHKINLEKLILDEISQLGLKTQQFEVVDIEIAVPGSPTRSIKGLLTQDFESLCQHENIVIHDCKGDKRVIGTAPDFHSMREQFKNKEFVQKMFKQLIKEYAVAYTFSLPINILQLNDDSQHIIFELPKDISEPPVVRYMFWDVVSDVKSLPFEFMVPTLNRFKRGPDEFNRTNNDVAALLYLSNTVACSIWDMHDHKKHNLLDIGDQFDFVDELQSDILKAINNDVFLKDALEHAQSLAIPYFNKLFDELRTEPKEFNADEFKVLMLMAISSGHMEVIEQVYRLRPQYIALSEKCIDSLLIASREYGNLEVIEFITSTLGKEKNNFEKERKLQIQEQENRVKSEELKNHFLQKYTKQLISDKRSWCGLYSFFATSHVRNEMDLTELVKHAQGLSRQGTGKRSQLVMKELGWLDADNNIIGELSTIMIQPTR
ncbi:hypothetical protein Lmor_1611 [Legionella moravica]|uniref:Uncharacterized protein n=1 Tax=Legionella moravica TaxID=39962 RepID=A0A378JXZ1_9GAMM|nr:hypothetical protein [Legionella moravica]KTD34214.1 hypothetical protein Lmor_1611 [Legionella moravica]STX62910.1 Uncharacterised protein [Legionella moravica]